MTEKKKHKTTGSHKIQALTNRVAPMGMPAVAQYLRNDGTPTQAQTQQPPQVTAMAEPPKAIYDGGARAQLAVDIDQEKYTRYVVAETAVPKPDGGDPVYDVNQNYAQEALYIQGNPESVATGNFSNYGATHLASTTYGGQAGFVGSQVGIKNYGKVF